MSKPVSRSLLSIGPIDETDIGARLLAARHARMRVENDREALRNRIAALKLAQSHAAAVTAQNHARNDELLKGRAEATQVRAQLSELREASLPSNPRFRSMVSASRVEQRDAIKQARAERLAERRAGARAVHAERSATERARAELEEERARAVRSAHERVLADRERSARSRVASLEGRRRDARLALDRLRAQTVWDQGGEAQLAEARERKALAREEADLLVRLARTHEAAIEASMQLDKLAAPRGTRAPERQEPLGGALRPMAQASARQCELLELADGANEPARLR
ncbi:hypothetical protein KFE25_005719 [Diacronema lutheri]|uniref:Uncharacterized protein n=1 Tax=Diacronema lutheri TaxID=2081491 RepID=A0A8J5X9H3_DIALT|nr:hypothetical protein KFE25_005719 [Diacronema lutheri]